MSLLSQVPVIGISLLLLSALVFWIAWHEKHTYNTHRNHLGPASAPMPLEANRTICLSFVAKYDFEYSVSLAFERTLPLDTLTDALQKIQTERDFTVSIAEDGQPIVASDYSGTRYSSQEIQLVLTSFLAHTNRIYDVTLISRADYTELASTKPALQVALAFWAYKKFESHTKNFVLLGTLLFLAAVASILFHR